MKIRLFFLSLLCLCITQAQGQDKECAAKASSIDSLVAAKQFDKAFGLWKSSQKCNSESLFRSGEKILQYNLSTPLSAADRDAQTAMLMQLYTDYDRNFPGNANSNAVKKAMHLYRHDDSNPEIFALLDRAFTNDREHFTDASAIQVYFDIYYKRALVQADQSMAPYNVIAKRDEVLQQLSKLFAATKNKNYQVVASGIRKQAAPMATCENLDRFYTKEIDFAKNKNAAWLQSVAEILSEDCQRAKIYYQVASNWYALEPNAKSAFHLAQASLQQRKSADAMKYFAIAAQSETDSLQKAEIYYTLAMRQITDAPTAVAMLRESLKAKPDFGKAYLLLAEVYASVDCGKTPFEKKARFELAAQTALKAGQIEAAIKKTAESQAAAYRKKAPSASEIKDAKMSGKTVSFGCGINESVTLP